jgi:hypothetical protein
MGVLPFSIGVEREYEPRNELRQEIPSVRTARRQASSSRPFAHKAIRPRSFLPDSTALPAQPNIRQQD